VSLDFWVEEAENIALKIKEFLEWLMVVLFAFTIGTMFVQVFWEIFRGQLLGAGKIIATLGTVMVLTLVADGFKIVKQDLKEVDTVKTVLKMSMVGMVANIFYNMRKLGDPDLLDFLHGFAAFGVILGVATLSYVILERSLD
jgi:hypothetical protein